jgi:hypothetical protein
MKALTGASAAVGHWLHRPARQDFRGLVRIARKMPAIVKHRLGEPFIGKVLQEIIEEGDGRIRWDELAVGIVALEAAHSGVESTTASIEPSSLVK